MNTARLVTSQQYAEDLRKRATPAERALCRLLDASRVSYVFQSNICDVKTGRIYICDFRIRRVRPSRPKGTPRKAWGCPRTEKLFVELDGSAHGGRERYDDARTRWIESHREAIVLRFSNADVFDRPDDVLRQIERYQPAHKTVRVSWTSTSRQK